MNTFSSLSSPPLISWIRISEEAAAMWKKHLERDDSRVVGEESTFSQFCGDFSRQPLMFSLTQTCSQASCEAPCSAQCAPTTQTRLTCSAICHCPSLRKASLGRSCWGTAWTSSLKRRNWTRRIHQWVTTVCKRTVTIIGPPTILSEDNN